MNIFTHVGPFSSMFARASTGSNIFCDVREQMFGRVDGPLECDTIL